MKRNKLITHLALLGLLLGIHNGYVALWKDGESKPVYISSCRAESLPKQDQIALEKGIPIQNRAQLEKLLEDYLS